MKNFNLIKRLWTDSHEKQKPQRFARYAAILIMLLTLGVGQMWATPSEGSDWRSASSAKVYFDNTNASYSNVSMLIGRQWSYDSDKKGSWGENFSLISGTNNLYYKSISCNHYTTFCFINASNWAWEENNTVTSRLSYCTNTDTPNDQLGTGTHLYVPASGSDGAGVTHTTPSSYSDLNYTQTLYQCVAENGGTPAKSTTSIGTISIATKYLSSASSTSNHNASISSGNNSCNTTAARTATVTMTATSIKSGYTFLGWYDSETGGTRLENSTTYTYKATGAKTVYARFSHETTHSVTIYYKCGSTNVTTQTSQAIGQVTASSITAPTVYGYTFTGWTLNTGISNQSASTSVNPISVKTLSSGTYNMTANYTEDLSSTWYVSGASGIFGGWGSSGKNMQRKTGYSTQKKFYYTIDATKVINGDVSDSDFEFKIYNSTGDSYRGNSGYWVTRSNNQPTLSSSSGDNMQFRPDAYGTYEFKVDCESPYSESAPKLTVTFGTKRKVTFGKRTGCKTVTAKYNNSVSMTSEQYVINGSSVTFSQTASDGYTFEGWYNAASGGTKQSASSSYTLTITGGDKTIYPNYTENTHTVTLANGGHGHVEISGSTVTSVSGVGIATASGTITAVPDPGYYFTGWTGAINSGVTLASGSTSSASITINATADSKTITANFAPIWRIAGGDAANTDPDDAMGNWSTTANQITNITTSAGVMTSGYVEMTLPANTEYVFKVFNASNSHYWGKTSTVTKMEYSNRATAVTLSDNTGNNQTFRTAAAGTYRFTWTGSQVSITYPASCKVTFGKGTGGLTITASGSTTGSLSSGDYVASGEDITFTETHTTPGYTLTGWYTTKDTGGSSVTGMSASDLVLDDIAADATVWSRYSENMTTVNLVASPTGKGTFTCGGGAVTSVSAGVTTHPSVTAVPATGYRVNTSATVWSESSDYISLSNTNTNPTTITATGTSGNSATLTATFTPNPYTITLKKHNGDDDGSVSVTYDATTNLTSAVTPPTRTGYTFGGYYTGEGGSGTQLIEDDGDWIVDNAYIHEDGYWINAGSVTLHAKWTAIDYTVELDIDEDNHGTIDGKDTEASVTFDAAPTSIASGKLPTAANGYALDGYYTDHDGEGVKVINADGTWISNVTGYMSSGNWVYADDVTLYAYYKKAEITNLVAEPGVIAPGETITITPTIEPTPTGTTKVCYEVQYSNGTPLPSQPSFDYDGNAVTFPVPSASATYIIQAVLETGSTCGSGTELSRRTTTFQVAGAHDVTVKYMCGDLTIKASEVLGEIRPLTWSDDITAPTITGYTFARWDAGDGVTIKDGSGEDKTTSTSSTIKIKAVYDGTLTAVYNKKNMIFFNNTLNWEHVYVYFYKNSSYWDDSNGAGTNPSYYSSSYSGKHGEMTQIDGTSVYYFDASDASADGYSDVAFTEKAQDNCWYFYDNNKVIKRGDYNASKLPMFVPLADQTPVNKNGNTAKYYDKGYWMNYPENSGYTLKIYNTWNATKETAAVQSIAFPYSEDLKMPLKLDVELSDGYNHNYWFMVYRNDGTYMGSKFHFKQGYQDEQVISGGNNKNQITTSAPGNYTFTLTYHDNGSGTNNYYIDVDFPIATGDYRIVYKDNAAWSHGTHGASWCHPSHSIGKATTEAKKDTVSFFISKAEGITPSMKFQKASITNEGVVTWADVAGGSITIPSSVTETGVYNFIVSQPAGGASISLEKVEPYTGNFYIRTDCAGNTKWDSFKNVDHQMTYSDYAEEYSGYSHYYAHWVESGNNVKFTIANDYSMCITDTLVEDYGTTIANISNIGVLNSGNASIRFMWNQATNKISRAYISGSSNVADRFLVLEGDAKMFDENGNALSISGLNPNEINLVDDQNFVYERTIQVKTTARAKLTAKYNNNVQYFKGSSGAFAEGTTIQLLGGDASDTKHTMRIVYDFKTNRLVTAYVPSGTIDAAIAINADLMIVREHQGAGQQLLFEGDGALSEVHTVYGVMRFNRWTLNNKEKTGEHSPVGDPKSIYERSLYWISFPFDVNLSDVFGFGTYGVDWIIEYYDGAERATNGYWIDSDGFWKMVMPAQRADFTLEAGKGYVLAIDVDAMKDNNTTFWANNIEQVELFFPSAKNVENITQTTAHTIVPEHECTIDRRTDKSVDNINKDRTKADSHWNMIGIPSYANYGATLTSDEEGTQIIRWNSTPYTNDLPFLYEWNMTDDSYTVQSGTTYPFKAMHAYMVQYHGDLYWSLASATPTPSPIVARRAYAEKPQNAEFRLELQQNEKMVDQTFVNMKDAEEISAGFKFDEDLCKEFNAGKANIYTLIENYLPAAGNTLPMSDQTTLVPVGVKTTAAGEYTFAMPEGTSGVSVVLIDNIAGTRTNLALSDYTVALSKGDLSDRFMLEIAPIKQMPTGIDAVSDQHSAVRKVMIDGILYIVKDGKVFDARGAKVK